eukprot:1738943-Prymnesium_polylepis.2
MRDGLSQWRPPTKGAAQNGASQRSSCRRSRPATNLQRDAQGIQAQHDKSIWHERAIKRRLGLDGSIVAHHTDVILARAVKCLLHEEGEHCRRDAGIHDEANEEADVGQQVGNDQDGRLLSTSS